MTAKIICCMTYEGQMSHTYRLTVRPDVVYDMSRDTKEGEHLSALASLSDPAPKMASERGSRAKAACGPEAQGRLRGTFQPMRAVWWLGLGSAQFRKIISASPAADL